MGLLGVYKEKEPILKTINATSKEIILEENKNTKDKIDMLKEIARDNSGDQAFFNQKIFFLEQNYERLKNTTNQFKRAELLNKIEHTYNDCLVAADGGVFTIANAENEKYDTKDHFQRNDSNHQSNIPNTNNRVVELTSLPKTRNHTNSSKYKLQTIKNEKIPESHSTPETPEQPSNFNPRNGM